MQAASDTFPKQPRTLLKSSLGHFPKQPQTLFMDQSALYNNTEKGADMLIFAILTLIHWPIPSAVSPIKTHHVIQDSFRGTAQSEG